MKSGILYEIKRITYVLSYVRGAMSLYCFNISRQTNLVIVTTKNFNCNPKDKNARTGIDNTGKIGTIDYYTR